MRALISGSTGLIGSTLCAGLAAQGYRIVRLVRRRSTGMNEILWDPARGRLDPGALKNIDAVIHLAGENLSGYWTRAKKKRIYESRVHGTRLLAEVLAQMPSPPRIWICASAVGYYGDRADEELSEQSGPGVGFLSQVCQDWERACEPAIQAGLRVVHMRLGVVLSRSGGALVPLWKLFRFGLGGRLGHGRQYMSWISLEDVLRAGLFLLQHDSIKGPVNLVAPQPIRNEQFTVALGRAVSRPAFFAVPGGILAAFMGEMAREMLLSSARAVPEKLLNAGFTFLHGDIMQALKDQAHRG